MNQEGYFMDSEDEDTYTEHSSMDKEDFYTVPSEIYNKHMALRISTAPARPFTDIEEFRRSSNFLELQHAVICASQLVQRSDNKYDLDSEDGQRACKIFLHQLEKLCDAFEVETESRDYRNEFSNAYRVLYTENSLCYLTEILDSAQEAFPYLWVNGQRYVFCETVLDAGSQIFNYFCKVQHILREIYYRACEETLPGTAAQIISDIKKALKEFDVYWVDFEKYYVKELMSIEEDARKCITDAIEIEKKMVMLEIREKAKGRLVLDCDEYNELREKLVKIIGKINSVANVEGKGRDDLGVNILISAEGLSRRMSSVQSKAVVSLSEKIRQSFNNLRHLFRKYENNIEIVDPQLKNNLDLVEALVKFESNWEKGKTYFLNPKRCGQLIHFSQLIEKTAQKYPTFREQLECRDAELFLSVPALLVLVCLENNDKGLCKRFYSPMYDEADMMGIVLKRLKRGYTLGKLAASSGSEYYELVEMAVLGIPISKQFRTSIISPKFDNLDSTIKKIKTLATELHRYRPAEWNRFLDITLVS
jgi:hypothetical protein